MHQRDTQYARLTAISCGILFLIALGFDYWPTSNPIEWKSLEAARAEARELNKPLFIDVYADWCVPCKNMDRFVFPDDSVRNILTTRYARARVNIDDPVLGDSVRKRFFINAVPTYIILTPGGRERKRHLGFFEKSGFIEWLTDSSRLTILSWLDLKKAEAKASAEDKRLMVLIANSNDQYTRLNSLFESPDVTQLIDSQYVPTLLVRSSPEDARTLSEFGGRRTWMNEVLVLEDGSEVGRFSITPDMHVDNSAFLSRLYELTRKKAPPNLGRVLPGRRIKKIS